jgi:hypothetical protein
VNLKHVIANNDESMSQTTKLDKTRQLSIEQENAIEHLLQGKSDRSVAEAVGVSRQTVWEWRNRDPLFIAELNRQRVELWSEARDRLKSLANRALDVIEIQLGSDDPKVALAAAKHVLQGTRLLGDTALSIGGPTTTEAVVMAWLRSEAKQELEADGRHRDPFTVDLFGIEDDVEDLAKSKLKKTLMEAGIT